MSRPKMELFAKLWDYNWDEEAWFLPLAQALEGVTPAQAVWQPPGGGNTIRQTLEHLNYYNERLLCRLTGTTFALSAANNDDTFGGAGDPADADGWQAELDRTKRIGEGLRKALAAMADADLATAVGTHTVGDTLTAWVMHTAYHTGQIVLIRKQQGSWPANRG